MLLLGTPFKDIDADMLDLLIDNAVAESRHLEYKSELPGNSDLDKKEFLFDVAAMANGGGGILLYGIQEKRDGNKATGIPESIPGITAIGLDSEMLRLGQICRSGINPRIHGIDLRQIPISAKHHSGAETAQVLALAVPFSLETPHMVKFQDRQYFYSRSTTGKYPMDINEIRSAVLSSADYLQRIEDWVKHRVNFVTEGFGTGTTRPNRPFLIQHIVPVRSMYPGQSITTDQINSVKDRLFPYNTISTKRRFTTEGFLVRQHSDRPMGVDLLDSGGYVHLYRNGKIESADTTMFNVERKTVPSTGFEAAIIERTKLYLKILMDLGMEPPVFISVTLQHVNGYQLGMPSNIAVWGDNPSFVDSTCALVPALLMDWREIENIGKVVRPILDNFWHACGDEGSINYAANGNWEAGGKFKEA
ncbi:MAG TPA: RNA-binding domain-containing protein [Candidatus Obscuribacterales bacterium]